MKRSLGLRSNSFAILFTISSAMAGAAVKPGDLIPATFQNSPSVVIMKSPPSGSARSPANCFMLSLRGGMPGTSFFAKLYTYSKPSCVVLKSSLEDIF